LGLGLVSFLAFAFTSYHGRDLHVQFELTGPLRDVETIAVGSSIRALRKVYERLPDPDGEREGFFRVIDEDEEDYLHPANYFVPVDLPKDVEKAIESAAKLETQHRGEMEVRVERRCVAR
jgi:hypothetical protein